MRHYRQIWLFFGRVLTLCLIRLSLCQELHLVGDPSLALLVATRYLADREIWFDD